MTNPRSRMPPIEAELSERFRRWEERTRGWRVYPHPVTLEPPFAPFPARRVASTPVADDGRRATAVSSAWQALWKKPSTPSAVSEDQVDYGPLEMERGPVVELPLYLPEGFNGKPAEMAAFFHSLTTCQEPCGFELVGTPAHVTAQFSVGRDDVAHVRQQMRTFFPDLVTVPVNEGLKKAWQAAAVDAAVVEFGLQAESMLPLAQVGHEPYVALVGILGDLAPDECAVLQVMWQGVENDWAEHLERSVSDAKGGAFFVNAPELAGGVKGKIAKPLQAVVVRVAARSASFDRTWAIIRALAFELRIFSHRDGNGLVALRNDHYPHEAHEQDLLRRQTRRPGMILNADELLALAHLPSSAVRSPKFRRMLRKTKAAPPMRAQGGISLGVNEHAGEARPVSLEREQRRRHMHVIGASGTGKTTLLYNLIQQDVEAGEGLAVLDPHGDLIDTILGIIPPNRIDDVVLLDPGDEEFSIGFNILSAHSDLEKNLLSSDLVSVFQRLSTSWGDQMGVVLGNAIRAFLESEAGGTLDDLERFLLEPGYRDKFLKTVRDPKLVYYWQKGFAQLTGNKSIGPVITRLQTFLGPKPIRYMVAQATNRLDFAEIMDGRKIFLAKLSQGAIGRENSHLLGSLLMAKFQQIAMGRQSQNEASRQDFWLYVDEFPNFMTASMAEILAGARKYRLGMTLAHQELRQLQRDSEVAGAVLANPYTRVCFRVGDADARVLANGFATFEAKDLQNLGTGEAVCRLERADHDFNLNVQPPVYPEPEEAAQRRQEVIAASRARYGTPRDEIEALLRARMEAAPEAPAAKPAKPRKEPSQPPASAIPVDESLAQPPPSLSLPHAAPVMSPAETVNQPVETAPTGVSQPATAPAATPELGRGGNQHQKIQKRLKAAAEALGFRAVIEHSILGGTASVDLALSRAEVSIACEINITTTIDYEVGNVAKCLEAGYPRVAMVSVSADRLAKLAEAVTNALGADAAARVVYFLPDQFIAHLQQLPMPPPPEPTVKEILGYKVKKKYPQLTPEERQLRESQAIDALADLMRNNAKKNPKPSSHEPKP